MVGFGSEIAIAYLLLIMRKMQCSENRQNVKGASLLREMKIPSRFENVRMDRVAAPYMLNGSPHRLAEMIFISPTNLVVEIKFHLPN